MVFWGERRCREGEGKGLRRRRGCGGMGDGIHMVIVVETLYF